MNQWSTTCAEDSAIGDAILAKAAELGITDEQLDKLTIEISFCKD